MIDKKQVGKYKAFFKQILNPNGELIKIQLNLSPHLKTLLKECVLSEKIEFKTDFGFKKPDGERIYQEFNRYKVKRILYSVLYGDFKDCLFICDLIDTGKYSFDFPEIEKAEKFKEDLKRSLFDLIKNALSSDLEQTIVYNVKTD